MQNFTLNILVTMLFLVILPLVRDIGHFLTAGRERDLTKMQKSGQLFLSKKGTLFERLVGPAAEKP